MRQLQAGVAEQREGQMQPLLRLCLVVSILGRDAIHCAYPQGCELSIVVSVRACLG